MEDTGSAGRKRKLKFSEKELEVLTEECSQHHDKLFGKAALSVPDTEKKKIWLQIQDRINAIGVSHCTLDEIKKRWYDLRSRTKERVAQRLREMRGTGGGPSTVPPPTAMEEMVEHTLEPEAVSGMGELDSFAPGTSKSLPHDTPSSDNIQGGDSRPEAVQEAAADIPGPSRTPPESPLEQEQEMVEALTTPGPNPTVSLPEPAARPRLRHRR
ncbi:myb-related transcription factor, partner of profilin-like [Pleurodeles waltl]|uniref:myb-related transcription factor, partner of profilin-like n=1 Tax=Pleurodeles waltl TaxID=8319 RepID=UPI0037095B29